MDLLTELTLAQRDPTVIGQVRALLDQAEKSKQLLAQSAAKLAKDFKIAVLTLELAHYRSVPLWQFLVIIFSSTDPINFLRYESACLPFEASLSSVQLTVTGRRDAQRCAKTVAEMAGRTIAAGHRHLG